jgi:hypothetical protein
MILAFALLSITAQPTKENFNVDVDVCGKDPRARSVLVRYFHHLHSAISQDMAFRVHFNWLKGGGGAETQNPDRERRFSASNRET